jgi:hypothetical protein
MIISKLCTKTFRIRTRLQQALKAKCFFNCADSFQHEVDDDFLGSLWELAFATHAIGLRNLFRIQTFASLFVKAGFKHVVYPLTLNSYTRYKNSATMW